MKKILIILFIFLTTTIPTFATTWVQIDSTTFIDKDSIKFYTRDNGEIDFTKKSFWIQQINDGKSDFFKKLNKISNTNIEYRRSREIIDIIRKKITTKSSAYYDIKGNVVYSNTNKDYQLDWQDIVPETNGELWFQLVRKKRLLNRLYKNQQLQQY